MTSIIRYEIKFDNEEEREEMQAAINEWLKLLVTDTKQPLSVMLMAPEPGSSETKYTLFSLAAPFTTADTNELAAKITYCLVAKLAIDRNMLRVSDETKGSLLRLYELLPKNDEVLAKLCAELDLVVALLPPYMVTQNPMSKIASPFAIPGPGTE